MPFIHKSTHYWVNRWLSGRCQTLWASVKVLQSAAFTRCNTFSIWQLSQVPSFKQTSQRQRSGKQPRVKSERHCYSTLPACPSTPQHTHTHKHAHSHTLTISTKSLQLHQRSKKAYLNLVWELKKVVVCCCYYCCYCCCCFCYCFYYCCCVTTAVVAAVVFLLLLLLLLLLLFDHAK